MKIFHLASSFVFVGSIALVSACHHQEAASPAPAQVQSSGSASPAPSPAPATTAALNNGHIEVTENVQFEENSDRLHASADHVLTDVIAVLHAHPEVTHLRVEGHTDAIGTPAHNQELSTHRAAAVVTYLRGHGVTITLDSAGFGATRALCSESTPECGARNRRVDFVVVP